MIEQKRSYLIIIAFRLLLVVLVTVGCQLRCCFHEMQQNIRYWNLPGGFNSWENFPKNCFFSICWSMMSPNPTLDTFLLHKNFKLDWKFIIHFIYRLLIKYFHKFAISINYHPNLQIEIISSTICMAHKFFRNEQIFKNLFKNQ